MIQPIENNRRKRTARKKNLTDMPKPKPEWAEAFMVLLLAKAGGKVSMPIERLEAFSKIKRGNATEMSYNKETKMVTLSLPEKLKVKLPVIAVPKKRIITR